MFTILTAYALASPPTANLRPAVVPWGVPEQYAEYAGARGRSEGLACDVVWTDHAYLCFRVSERGASRWVTSSDLVTWQVDAPTLRALLLPEAKEQLAGGQSVAIEGMEASYYQLRSGEGWAAAGILNPAELASRLGGGPLLAAIPAEGILVAWKPGTPDVDHVMLVGVRELHEALPVSVSPMAFQWDGEKWLPFGRADPVQE